MNARRIFIGIAAVAALLVAAIASLPFFVDQDRVRRVVEQRISAVAGGEVHYESLKLRFFPQPSVEARNATVRIPGVLEGRVDTLAIRIALLPLLTGNVRPVAVNLAQPTLEVTIQPGGGSGGGDPFAAYRAALGPVVDALVRDASGMSLGVTDGKVVVVYAGQRIVSLSGLTADAQVAADALTVGASGAADLWRTASANLKIAPDSLAATGKLQLSGLRLAELLQAAGAQGEVRVSAGAIDASLDAQTDGRASVRGTLTAAAPDVTLARAARTLRLGAVRAVLDAQRDGTALTASVRELKAGDLLPAATGTLRAKPDGSAPTVALQVPALDLARLRTALVALAGDLDGVQAALAFVPTGTVQALNITAAGSDFGALAALGSMRAEGQLANGALELPTFGIAVTGGVGRFALADGTLRWSELAGAIGKSTFTGGTLTVDLIPDAVDLIPDPALRKLEATVDADLAGTLPIVRRLVGRPEPAALANVESLRGRASGTVVYEADRRRAHVAVDLSRVQGNVRYRGVPLPIEVTGGAVRYAGDRLDVRGLDGRVGRSQVRAGAMELVLGSVPTVRAASADAVVVLDEIYPWLASIEGLRRPTSAIPSESGTVAVRLVRLSGPLNQPAALDYEAVLRPQQVRIAGPTLPAPVTVTGGEVRVTPRTVALDRLDAVDARRAHRRVRNDRGLRRARSALRPHARRRTRRRAQPRVGAHALAAAAQGDASRAAHARLGALAARWRPSGPARRASVARPRQRRAGRFRPHRAIGPLRSAATGGERPRHQHDCVAEVGGLDARAHVQREARQPHARPGARSSAERGWRAAGRFQRGDRSRRPAAVERRGSASRATGSTSWNAGTSRSQSRASASTSPATWSGYTKAHSWSPASRSCSPGRSRASRRRSGSISARRRTRLTPSACSARSRAARPGRETRPAGTCRSMAASPSTRRASPTVGTSCGRSRVPSRSRRSASWRT